jgi:hypothetical protein
MFKLLALLVLFWILFRAVGMVIKMVIGSNPDTRQTRYSNPNNPKRKGDINIDHNPKKSNKGYEGGEYVDYEDVD